MSCKYGNISAQIYQDGIMNKNYRMDMAKIYIYADIFLWYNLKKYRRRLMKMAISKAAQRAVNKYMKENYDRVNLTMPKGKKEELQIQAANRGMSVNAYINTAIDEKMERDKVQNVTE